MERAQDKIRNVAIVAHVDHGKTTLVDAMLKQSGIFRDNEVVADRVLDSNDLERERGITILAKHCSVSRGDYTINIIDTPGHSDFGGEVERTLRMADGTILLVDAAEGPLPQTRFVLGKALELGHRVLLVINKVDRQDARPEEVLNEAFDLFCELGATDEQADFPTLYAIGKDGVCGKAPDAIGKNLNDLFDLIINEVPAPGGDREGALQFLVHNIQHDEYVGRLGIGRVYRGNVNRLDQATLITADTEKQVKVGDVWGFEGMKRVKFNSAGAGDIIAISGIDGLQIGDSITDLELKEALPRIEVEQPTIKVRFVVNTSPFAGLSGKWVTSRHLRERLEKEAKTNLALRVEETDSPDAFVVHGRGELMLAILAETMRREGYEFALGMPEVVIREIDGKNHEPVEEVTVDVPEEHVGAITTALGERRGQMTDMRNIGVGRSRVVFKVPSRGLIGFRSLFLTLSRGTGLLNTRVVDWAPYAGMMLRRQNGAIVADRKGATTPYALFNLLPRGSLFVGISTDVYEGMIIGEHNRPNDLEVNAVREKKLTNIRAAGKDENTVVADPKPLTIEGALEWIDQDEFVEITPDSIRIRKQVLQANIRPRRDGPRK